PYPAYKFSSIQSVAMPYVGLISEAHQAVLRLSALSDQPVTLLTGLRLLTKCALYTPDAA
ncbi:hypothetical protein, partial [Escherichia coli]|uniref:hypothetical protein n=1 Tax=Escherichia coli TaxID=562 RepID=UPI001BDBB2F7